MGQRPKKPRSAKQRTYFLVGEYADEGCRLLIERGAEAELYSVDLGLAQHWYAAAWRGNAFDPGPFAAKCLDPDVDRARAKQMKESGLVLAQCLRHGQGMPVVDEVNGHPIYGSGVDVLIGEVFEAALGDLIETETGIPGLTISPMHTGYALKAGRVVGGASIEQVAKNVRKESPDLAQHVAPDGTVTIFFSDIEGSTSLNERLGDAAWTDVLREHNEVVRRERGLHGGYEVKTIGDAFMLAFRSARDALRCAIRIQHALERRSRVAKVPVRVRIGLHTGEFVREANDFFGRHVNFAARVASKASGGEILVSSLLRELVEPSGEFAFGARRTVALKGLKGKHRLHAVMWRQVNPKLAMS